MNFFPLTVLSNVVAYACRPWSRKIGMNFISIDSSAGAARSVAAAGRARTGCRRLVRGRQMSGGKGAKGGNLECAGKTGPAGDVAQRRKPAETGENLFLRPYSGAQVFSAAGIGPPRRAVGDWRIACGNCGNPHDESHRGLASALRNLRNLGNLQAGNRVAVAEIAEIPATIRTEKPALPKMCPRRRDGQGQAS
jgi:hypothetical protein